MSWVGGSIMSWGAHPQCLGGPHRVITMGSLQLEFRRLGIFGNGDLRSRYALSLNKDLLAYLITNRSTFWFLTTSPLQSKGAGSL